MLGGFFWLPSKGPAKLTEKDTVVLTEFENKTQDPVFDDTLRQALTVKLEQSPFLNILSERKTEQTVRLMGLRVDQPITGEIARDLCQRVGGKVTLAGSIVNLGGEYVVGLTATNCATGDSIATQQARASQKSDVLKALDKAASQLRDKLGESLASIQKFDTPLEETTTSSLEGLKAYSLGLKAHREKGDTAALPFFQHAVQLDPNFAMSYRALSGPYSGLGESEQAQAVRPEGLRFKDRVYGERAAHYREQLPPDRDRGFGEGRASVRVVRADLSSGFARALQPGLHRLVRLDATRKHWRSIARSFGGSRECAQLHQRRWRLIDMNRFDEARDVLHQAQQRKLDDELLWINLYSIAFQQT